MNQDQLYSAIRQLLVALGAILITKGVVSSQIWEILIGVLPAAFGLIWAITHHSTDNQAAKAVETVAKAGGIVVPPEPGVNPPTPLAKALTQSVADSKL